MYNLGLEKPEEIANVHWIIEKALQELQNTSASLSKLKPLIIWTITNCGKFLNHMGIPDTIPVSWEIWMQEKQWLELDMEKLTSSKLGKEYVKLVYCHPAYLTYMKSTSCKMLGWMTHNLKSRLL